MRKNYEGYRKWASAVSYQELQVCKPQLRESRHDPEVEMAGIIRFLQKRNLHHEWKPSQADLSGLEDSETKN